MLVLSFRVVLSMAEVGRTIFTYTLVLSLHVRYPYCLCSQLELDSLN